MQYAKELIDSGFVGEPYIFNGFEQNSQWIDPATPLRQFDADADPAEIAVSSIEGYGAPIIDIMHWWLGAPLTAVVGAMRNFVPERMIRDTGELTRANIDDGDMWIAEFGGGALASIQSSYVTVGNYPGIEARIYGSEGAVIVRLVDEFGICQTIKTARKDAVEFTEAPIPDRFFPPGGHSGEPWEYLFYSNLVSDFVSEILDGSRAGQGDFAQGALVQETINAFEASFRRRAWVSFPLEAAGSGRAVKAATNAAGWSARSCPARSGPPLADRHAYRVGPDGQPFLLPGMGGVTLGVHCADPATGYASDHLEPGASIRHRDPAANMALQFLTCVGNEVRVAGGPGRGRARPRDRPARLRARRLPRGGRGQPATGDQVTVLATGQGLALADHPAIAVKNCDPGLLAAMPGGTRPDGRLEVHVAARVPAEAIGAGAGMVSEYANTDLMGAYAGPRRGPVARPGGPADRRHRGAGGRRPPLRPRLPAGLPDHRGHLHRPVHAVRPRAGPEHADERAGRRPSAGRRPGRQPGELAAPPAGGDPGRPRPGSRRDRR